MVSNIVLSAQGFSRGISLASTQATENSMRAGRNTFYTGLLQSAEVFQTLGTARKVFSAANRSFLSSSSQRILYLAPFATAYLLKKIENKALHDAVLFLQDHIGAACQSATAVLLVAMVFFGHTYYGYACLLALTIGYLDRQGILPETARHMLHRYFKPILFTLGLFTAEGTFDFVLSLFFVLSSIDEYFVEKKPPIVVSPAEPKLLTPQIFRALCSPQVPALQILQSYLHEPPSPPVPNIDITILETQFDQINWEASASESLRVYLGMDPRFLEEHQTVEGKSDDELRKYAKKSLKELITSIKKGHIPDGEPTNYDRAREYLQTIAHVLQTETDPVTKTYALIRLAVNGEYCGPGRYEAIEGVYNGLVLKQTDIPLRTKLLFCLQDYRRGLFDRVFYRIHNIMDKGIGKFFDVFDLHHYNTHVRIYNQMYALNRLSTDNDSVAVIDSFSRRVLRYFGWEYTIPFEYLHTPDGLVEHLQKTIGTASLSKGEFYTWFRGWIERSTPTLKDRFTQAIADGKCETNEKIKAVYIQAFLVDMGILEVSTAGRCR